MLQELSQQLNESGTTLTTTSKINQALRENYIIFNMKNEKIC